MDESWLVPRGFSGWLIGRKFQGVRLQRALRETWQSHRSNREKASPAMAPTS
jgi:hypothetical protein